MKDSQQYTLIVCPSQPCWPFASKKLTYVNQKCSKVSFNYVKSYSLFHCERFL